jgi:hypothetical protein
VEAEASAIRTYQLGFVPGLLQTETYMRLTFSAARQRFEGERLENEVAVRLRRQRSLFDDPVLTPHAIVDETVLHRESCDREQLDHIVAMAALPNVTVQVIPHSAGVHPGMHSNFILVSFPDPAEPDLAYVEYGFGSLQIEKEREVRAVPLLFDHLADLALDQQDSVGFIAKL